MEVFHTNTRIPVKSWSKNTEAVAIKQAVDLANLPFAFHHVALMPDCHRGYGMPIGGVLATVGKIIPNAVGKDIGCGMSAVKFSLKELPVDVLKSIMGNIREKVPVGFNHHKEDRFWDEFSGAPDIRVIQEQIPSARKQLGTLGGGNHFIEIQKDEEGFIWAMIHSGSRNFGLKIADEYNRIATTLCQRWCSNIPEIKGEEGLAFLPIETKEGKEYLQAMNFALLFAKENRSKIMAEVITSVLTTVKEPVLILQALDIHHNYAVFEHHFDKNILVHRKGATSAKLGELGIIPGSQGTCSYIVEGLGNPDSFNSCSHGAGRKMSRSMARKNLNLEEEKKKLDDKGIIHAIRHESDLDEASSAYKDIDEVMENQQDLVKIVHKLTPLGVIKG